MENLPLFLFGKLPLREIHPKGIGFARRSSVHEPEGSACRWHEDRQQDADCWDWHISPLLTLSSCRNQLSPLSQGGEHGDVVQDPIEEIVSGEEEFSHPDTSPKTPFRFRRTSPLPSERLVSSEHQHHCTPTPKNRGCYCIRVRVMLRNAGDDQPHHPMHGEDV